jgi:hypothetical protein
MQARFLAVVTALALTGATPSSAQTTASQSGARSAPMLAAVDTSVFRGLRFRVVGPPRGGRVTTVTGVPSQPRTFDMGVASGGVLRTTDAIIGFEARRVCAVAGRETPAIASATRVRDRTVMTAPEVRVPSF